MTDHIGTATIKVLPDLAEFQEILDQIPAAGLTITTDTRYERDENGYVSREVTTKTVGKAI